ncbi:hypothetical protein O181_036091 [Austropuccinia psidii MF-1]|uniref:Major facilitator superfamily (MFS) profile domain-containing protein n=1 Tax=Austropuccinia psidii MF-1 TaxID=1389203 RepID=A0A9Q3H9L2_9BASI|nr:hypothetical protein [Austropuccinia psidii MF-1]
MKWHESDGKVLYTFKQILLFPLYKTRNFEGCGTQVSPLAILIAYSFRSMEARKIKVEDNPEAEFGLGVHSQQACQPRNGRKWIPSFSEATLLLIASTGFFIDAYDLFTINLVVPILNVQYNGKLGSHLGNAALGGGVLKAATNLGCIVGQILFGALGDIYGRKRIYYTALLVAICGTVLTISAPNSLGANGVFTWITISRVLLGIGIGGDYPMSASAISDRANIDRRGLLLSFTFAMQGWGNFCGALVSIVVLSAFQTSIQEKGKYENFNLVWRIILGIILVPALGTLYQRIKLPESDRMIEVLNQRKRKKLKCGQGPSLPPYEEQAQSKSPPAASQLGASPPNPMVHVNKRNTSHNGTDGSALQEFVSSVSLRYPFKGNQFNLQIIGISQNYQLLAKIFWSMEAYEAPDRYHSLNQSLVIADIGYDKATEPWQNSFDNTKANLIITVAGFLPGYYFTMFFVEYIGRKALQIGGFLLEGLFLAIVAGDFCSLSIRPTGFLVCFIFLQFFFNFGANTTAFIYPAEVFPTRMFFPCYKSLDENSRVFCDLSGVRSFANGISAAGGKVNMQFFGSFVAEDLYIVLLNSAGCSYRCLNFRRAFQATWDVDRPVDFSCGCLRCP